MTLYEAREQIRRNTILVDVSDLELEDVLFDNKRECIRNFKDLDDRILKSYLLQSLEKRTNNFFILDVSEIKIWKKEGDKKRELVNIAEWDKFIRTNLKYQKGEIADISCYFLIMLRLIKNGAITNLTIPEPNREKLFKIESKIKLLMKSYTLIVRDSQSPTYYSKIKIADANYKEDKLRIEVERISPTEELESHEKPLIAMKI